MRRRGHARVQGDVPLQNAREARLLMRRGLPEVHGARDLRASGSLQSNDICDGWFSIYHRSNKRHILDTRQQPPDDTGSTLQANEPASFRSGPRRAALPPRSLIRAVQLAGGRGAGGCGRRGRGAHRWCRHRTGRRCR